MFLINFNQWKCACVGINNLVIETECLLRGPIWTFKYSSVNVSV